MTQPFGEALAFGDALAVQRLRLARLAMEFVELGSGDEPPQEAKILLSATRKKKIHLRGESHELHHTVKVRVWPLLETTLGGFAVFHLGELAVKYPTARDSDNHPITVRSKWGRLSNLSDQWQIVHTTDLDLEDCNVWILLITSKLVST